MYKTLCVIVMTRAFFGGGGGCRCWLLGSGASGPLPLGLVFWGAAVAPRAAAKNAVHGNGGRALGAVVETDTFYVSEVPKLICST